MSEHGTIAVGLMAVNQDWDMPIEAQRNLALEMWAICSDRSNCNRDRMRAAEVLNGLAKHNQVERLASKHMPTFDGTGPTIRPLHLEIQQMLASLPLAPPQEYTAERVETPVWPNPPLPALSSSCQRATSDDTASMGAGA